ncbi:unnamed protein product [Brassicogethes aeneus]|uniref:UBA domain-containing protein n=1 Tax=Brassicogethes aeneus TaxID=1431903 RepID=A0A9P0FF92_BRAAE|nr:unnamed protein product [Brassicogethes aeneus]
MSSLTLGLWNSNQLKRIKIENVNLDGKVEEFKSVAKKNLGGNHDIELSYCGVIMEDENTLSSYGVTPGVIVYGLEKKKPLIEVPKKKYTEVDVQQIVVAFKSFTMSSGYRNALQRLSRVEVLDKIKAAIPGLGDDPVALAIIQDPELIVHMSDPDTVRKVSETHPVLIEAANYIAAHIREEHTMNPLQAGTSTGYSYSLEALSDDDDLDSDTNMQQHPLSRNSSYNAITAAQLAAAIANATNTAFNTNSAGMPTTPSGSSLITNEMFNSAMQHAFTTASEPSYPMPMTPTEDIRTRLQPQLQQMHELGLLNDMVNVRALQVTGGDVQAAIELVFNGTID